MFPLGPDCAAVRPHRLFLAVESHSQPVKKERRAKEGYKQIGRGFSLLIGFYFQRYFDFYDQLTKTLISFYQMNSSSARAPYLSIQFCLSIFRPSSGLSESPFLRLIDQLIACSPRYVSSLNEGPWEGQQVLAQGRPHASQQTGTLTFLFNVYLQKANQKY